MPELFPFPGLRYQPGALGAELSAVTAPPYDMIDEEGRGRLEAAHPRNAVRLILPRDVELGDRFRQARSTFEAWQAEGVLAADEPHLYVYRMIFTDEAGAPRRMLGVIGALELSPFDADDVVPHESTITKGGSDRLEMLREVRANLDPVWALTSAEEMTPLLESVLAITGAAAACVTEDGVEHCLFPVAGEIVDHVRAAISGAPLLIADGHHRYETALAYQEERRAAGGDDPGADRIMALIVEISEDQLLVQPFHRLMRGVTDRFRDELKLLGDATPLGANTPGEVQNLLTEMKRTGSMGLIGRSGVALLRPRSDVLRPLLDLLPEQLHDIDAVMFEVVLDRIAASTALPDLEYRKDGLAVAAMVARGAADAAILLRAPSVGQIAAVAAAGARTPPKTTFFSPKPLTGLVFRSLDRG